MTDGNIARHGIVHLDTVAGTEGGICRWRGKHLPVIIPTYIPIQRSRAFTPSEVVVPVCVYCDKSATECQCVAEEEGDWVGN